jgi:hypothetical protein
LDKRAQILDPRKLGQKLFEDLLRKALARQTYSVIVNKMAKKLVVPLKRAEHLQSAQDLAAALRPVLESQHGIELLSLEGETSQSVIRGRAKTWLPLRAKELGPLTGVHVSLPVNVEVRLEGESVIVITSDPAVADITEAESFVAGLAARGEVVMESTKTPLARTTHRVEMDEHGRRLLKRARFSALKL